MSLYYDHLNKYIDLTNEIQRLPADEEQKMLQDWKTGEGFEWKFNGKDADKIFTLTWGDKSVATISRDYMENGIRDKSNAWGEIAEPYCDDAYRASNEAASLVGLYLDDISYEGVKYGEIDVYPHSFCNHSYEIGIKLLEAMTEHYDIMPPVYVYNFENKDYRFSAELQTSDGYTFDVEFDKNEDGRIDLTSYNHATDLSDQIKEKMADPEYPMPKAVGKWLLDHVDGLEKEVIACSNEMIERDEMRKEQKRERGGRDER